MCIFLLFLRYLDCLPYLLHFFLGFVLVSRGAKGDLRVGVRRVACQQSQMPSSVISSHSMHLGVLATASHAVSTGTLFVVYYKPRCICLFWTDDDPIQKIPN